MEHKTCHCGFLVFDLLSSHYFDSVIKFLTCWVVLNDVLNHLYHKFETKTYIEPHIRTHVKHYKVLLKK